MLQLRSNLNEFKFMYLWCSIDNNTENSSGIEPAENTPESPPANLALADQTHRKWTKAQLLQDAKRKKRKKSSTAEKISAVPNRAATVIRKNPRLTFA